MSFFILSTPLGVIIGYILTAVVINQSTWQVAFYIMSLNMLMVGIGMAYVDVNYVNYDLMIKQISHNGFHVNGLLSLAYIQKYYAWIY